MVTSPLLTQLSGNAESPLDSVESVQPAKRLNLNSAWPSLALPTTPLFGTDGIRGKAGELLNPPLVLQVGFWVGQVLRNATTSGPIILGQDSRNSSDMLAMAISAGLTAAGLEVWHLGICPTPCVAYLASISKAVGGVMISASHNPPEDNGIKVFGPEGTKLSLELQEQIEAGLRGKLDFTGSAGGNWGRHYQQAALVERYAESLQQPLRSLSLQGMKIVLDLAWGAAVTVAPQVFGAMGAEVICLHDRPDGDRINVNCGSTHLDLLRSAVQHHDADLGFAFDGDADRVLAVDAKGRVVDGDYILYLWGEHLTKTQQLPENLIVSTVMANLGFERAWQQLGGRMVRTSVGDRYVHEEMLRLGGVLGGEQSGHILCRHYGVSGDGVQTALHLAALVKQSGACLSQLRDRSFQTYPQLLKNVRVEDRERRLNWENCDALKSAVDRAQTAMGEQGRVLVRASGTEPVIRVMVEAVNLELATHWADNLVSAVQQYSAV